MLNSHRLMVLCPFVFLLTRHDVPSPKLQPTEVGSTHWVSLRALLSPSLRTFERADVSDRLARKSSLPIRGFLRLMLGQMLFAAVRLIPTENLYCSSAPGFLPDGSSTDPAIIRSIGASFKHWWLGDHAGSPSTDRPLLLWGLTLGILADFLEMLPPHNALSLWNYPTFTALDVRWITWAVTYSLRKRKRAEIEQGRGKAPAAVEEGLDAIALPHTGEAQDKPGEVGIGGLGVGRYYGRLQHNRRGSRSSAVGVMLDGYYDLLRKAVLLTFIFRLGAGSAVGFLLWRRFIRQLR